MDIDRTRERDREREREREVERERERGWERERDVERRLGGGERIVERERERAERERERERDGYLKGRNVVGEFFFSGGLDRELSKVFVEENALVRFRLLALLLPFSASDRGSSGCPFNYFSLSLT
jgi:hypothetical protein